MNPDYPSPPGLFTRRALLRRSGTVALGLPALHLLDRGSAAQAAQPSAGGSAADPTWLKAKYGPWGGPGVNATPGPMDEIRVRDYAPVPSLVLPQTVVDKARFPVIDIHAHSNARTPEEVAAWVRTMDEVGIATTVVLAGTTGDAFARMAELYLSRSDRFQVYCGLLATNIERPDYPEQAAAEL